MTSTIYPVFDNPRKSEFNEPYMIMFPLGKDAVGHIVLNEDGIDAIIRYAKENIPAYRDLNI